MSISYNWQINTLDRTLSSGIVSSIHYSVIATEGEYTSSSYGSVGLEPPAEGDPIIPYGDLTAETVVGWLQTRIGSEDVNALQLNLQRQIDEQRTPTTGSGLPW